MPTDTTLPVGGVAAFKQLEALATHYRQIAVDQLDYDAAALALALNALVVQASRAGLHVHMTVLHEED